MEAFGSRDRDYMRIAACRCTVCTPYICVVPGVSIAGCLVSKIINVLCMGYCGYGNSAFCPVIRLPFSLDDVRFIRSLNIITGSVFQGYLEVKILLVVDRVVDKPVTSVTGWLTTFSLMRIGTAGFEPASSVVWANHCPRCLPF